MADDPPELEIDDFVRVDWQSIATDEDVDETDLLRLSRIYQHASQEEEDSTTARVLEELGHLCSLRLHPDEGPDDPFIPIMQGEGFRTARVADLEPVTIEACAKLGETAPSRQLLARMADVAWVASRDHESARLAHGAYLACAQSADLPDEWYSAHREFERAFQIALLLGDAEMLEAAQTLAEDLIEEAGPEDELSICATPLELIRDYGRPSESRLDLVPLTDQIAERAYEQGAFEVARRYWNIASDLATAAKNREVKKREARRPFAHRVADAFEADADRMLEGEGGSMVAADYLHRAIEALRRVGSEEDRIERLHRRMIEAQKEIPSELMEASHSVDITDQVKRSRDRVDGLDLPQALRELALAPPIPEVQHLREQAEEMADQYVSMGLFPKVVLSSEGKVVQRYGSILNSEAERRQAALRGVMLKNASIEQSFAAQAVINPIRQKIVRDHPLGEGHLMQILRYNHLVPYDREELYTRGLVAGFYGKLPTALHLLVPQLEHSLRVLLEQQGLPTSSKDNEGIQQEIGINRLLFEHEKVLEDVFGEDTVFALQGLLVEKYGGDFRNRVAHGLAGADKFKSGAALYLWWLICRLSTIPFVSQVFGVGADDEGG